MTEPGGRAALAGTRVLLVHENAFHGQYLADVIADSGAILGGPVSSARQAIVSLEQEGPWSALVLSGGVDDGGAVAGVAAEIGVALLYVRASRVVPPPPLAAARVMNAPFAAFQVVEALAAMIAEGPRPRGALREGD